MVNCNSKNLSCSERRGDKLQYVYVQEHVRKLSRELSDITLLHHQLMEDNELLREQLQESQSVQAQLTNEVIT